MKYYICRTGTMPDATTISAGDFVGNIDLFAFDFNFIPQNANECDGQLLSINPNQVLYSLIGIIYGGNGTTNFNLPNLAGAIPLPQIHYYITMNGDYPSITYNVPIVSSVSVPANGNYLEGQTLNFSVLFNANVTITGVDSTLSLNIGGVTKQASFVSKTQNSKPRYRKSSSR